MTQTDRIAGLQASVAIKAPCRVATTANITLSGLQTVDGIALAAGDRVLVKDQTDAKENGIYVAAATAWSRARDFNGARDAVQGTILTVTSGTTNGGEIFKVTASGIVFGTTDITFESIGGTLTPPVPIADGGTGATTADNALTNLGGTTVGKDVFKAADAAAARSAIGAVIGTDVQAFDADILKADATDVLTKGFTTASHNLGNLNAATTLHISDGQEQHGTMTGSFTLTAPDDTDEGGIDLELTMDATGGYTLTLSGFNEVSGTFDNTANKVNVLEVRKKNTNTYLHIYQAV